MKISKLKLSVELFRTELIFKLSSIKDYSFTESCMPIFTITLKSEFKQIEACRLDCGKLYGENSEVVFLRDLSIEELIDIVDCVN